MYVPTLYHFLTYHRTERKDIQVALNIQKYLCKTVQKIKLKKINWTFFRMAYYITGDLVTNVVYTLTEDNSLEISFTSMTNKPTLVNMGSHCFFNLGKVKS